MDKKSVGEVSKILTRWIAVARARTQKKEPLGEHTKSIKTLLALHHARDIADGIAYQCYPDIDETVAEIKIVFDGMDQQNPELIEVRRVLKI